MWKVKFSGLLALYVLSVCVFVYMFQYTRSGKLFWKLLPRCASAHCSLVPPVPFYCVNGIHRRRQCSPTLEQLLNVSNTEHTDNLKRLPTQLQKSFRHPWWPKSFCALRKDTKVLHPQNRLSHTVQGPGQGSGLKSTVGLCQTRSKASCWVEGTLLYWNLSRRTIGEAERTCSNH